MAKQCASKQERLTGWEWSAIIAAQAEPGFVGKAFKAARACAKKCERECTIPLPPKYKSAKANGRKLRQSFSEKMKESNIEVDFKMADGSYCYDALSEDCEKGPVCVVLSPKPERW